jgi:hypothetical protein
MRVWGEVVETRKEIGRTRSYTEFARSCTKQTRGRNDLDQFRGESMPPGQSNLLLYHNQINDGFVRHGSHPFFAIAVRPARTLAKYQPPE